MSKKILTVRWPKLKLPKIKWPPIKRPKRSPKELPKKEEKIHPWRMCPKGQHYREGGPVSAYIRKGRPVRASNRGWTCVKNRSGKDQMYPEEMNKIAEKYFHIFQGRPLGTLSDFKEKGDQYDYLIHGWVKYWNDILEPLDSLDPHVVKALIASESSFNPRAWNKRKKLERADGLMQVTHQTVRYLKDDFKELRDHYLNFDPKDMMDPNLSICAGVRWLFRKREIVQTRKKRPVTWHEVVAGYKSVKINDDLMADYQRYYAELKGKYGI